MLPKLNFGIVAEYIAIVIYMIKCYRILRHRIRNVCGEIDIIALRNKTIVFIEVKARSSYFDQILLSKHQQNRIKKAAELFITQNLQYQHYDLRFDLVVIRSYNIPHIIQNAW